MKSYVRKEHRLLFHEWIAETCLGALALLILCLAPILMPLILK